MLKKKEVRKSFGKDPWTTVCSIIIHLSIAIPLAAALNIWVDEAYTMATIKGSISYTFHKAITFEVQPPLYFLLMNLWGKLGSSVFFLRSFSILCIVLTIWVSSKLAKRYLPDIHAGWLTMAVAVNPYSIWAATEMRLYAFLTLLTSILMLTFHEGFMSEGPASTGKRRWFFVFCVLSLYTQYYTVFMLAAMFFGLIILKKWEALKKLAGYYVLAMICFLPMMLTALRQTALHTKFILINNTLLNLLSVGTRFLRYVVRLEWLPTAINMLVYAGFLAAIVYVVSKYRKNLKDAHKMIWSMTLVITLFFIGFMNLVNHELVNTTHTTVLFIPALLAFFSIMDILPASRVNKILIPAFAAMFLVNSIYIIREYQPMAKMGDFKRVADYISKRESPGQGILIFTSNEMSPFSFYYSGTNTIIPIPFEESTTRFDVTDLALKSEQDIQAAIEKAGLQADFLWVVNRTLCEYLGVNFHCEILEDYIKKHFTVEDEKDFYHSKVRLLRPRDKAQILQVIRRGAQ